MEPFPPPRAPRPQREQRDEGQGGEQGQEGHQREQQGQREQDGGEGEEGGNRGEGWEGGEGACEERLHWFETHVLASQLDHHRLTNAVWSWVSCQTTVQYHGKQVIDDS